jgi:pyrimidine deaminase RibD-like protein
VIINEILTAQSDPQAELDLILAKCCEMILDGQEQEPDYYGMVAACVICPDGKQVYGINYDAGNGKRVHAERAAIDACEQVGPECMIVTTCSPCNQPMDERYGESCDDLISSIGIKHVYCGYKDPSQDADTSIETHNPKLRELCKRFADTFLKESVTEAHIPYEIEEFLDGLLPDDVGVEEFGTYRVHFEGFTDDCQSSADYCENPEAVYKQVYADFVQREGGRKPLVQDMTGDEDYPILYSIFKIPTIKENFADGKVKGKSRPGRVKRAGASCNGSVTDLRRKAKNASGERARMYHWCANMKAGRNK